MADFPKTKKGSFVEIKKVMDDVSKQAPTIDAATPNTWKDKLVKKAHLQSTTIM